MKWTKRVFLGTVLLAAVSTGGVCTEQRTVLGSYINVRQEGNFRAPIITKKLRGDSYMIEYEKDSWARVTFTDGTKGWIFLSRLERPRPVVRAPASASASVVPPSPGVVQPSKDKAKPVAVEKKKSIEAEKPAPRPKPEPRPRAKPGAPLGPTVIPGVVSTTKTAEEFYNEAVDLYKKRRYAQALEANRAALAQAPRNSEILNNLANCLFKLGRVPEAITHWKKALEIVPTSAKISNNLGIAHYQLDQNDRAIEFYQKAILFDPQFADAYYNLASVFGFKGRFQEAIDYYRKFLEFTPDKTMRRLTEERIDYCQKQIQSAAASAKEAKPVAVPQRQRRSATASAPAPVALPATPTVHAPSSVQASDVPALTKDIPPVAPKPPEER